MRSSIKIKLRKKVKNASIIECPFCGCSPSEGFDCMGPDCFNDDEYERHKYHCQKCGNDSVRCYVFYAWENEDGEELEEE